MATNNEDRRKKLYQQREELSEEGKELWDSMMAGDIDAEAIIANIERPNVQRVTRRVKEVIVETDESQRIRLEMRRMIQNSKVVVAECEQLMKEYVKKEQYFKANEARVAALCHKNFIERLQRILDGQSAFDKDIPLPDTTNTTNTIFVR